MLENIDFQLINVYLEHKNVLVHESRTGIED